MINIILLILTTTAGFLFGNHFEKRMTCRERLYGDLVQFCRQMENNVSYGHRVLSDFCDEFAAHAGQDFRKLLYGVRSGSVTMLPLSAAEKKYLSDFFVGLSAANSDMYLGHLAQYREYFSQKFSAAQNDVATKGKIGQKTGIVVGMIVGLILI